MMHRTNGSNARTSTASRNGCKPKHKVTSLKGIECDHPVQASHHPVLQDLTPTARAIGAVNAIKPSADGWVGHNTDAEGFMKSLRPLTSCSRAALIWATGAAAAVRFGLQSLGVGHSRDRLAH